MKRWLVILVPVAIILGLVGWKLVGVLTGGAAGGAARQRPAVAVEIAPVQWREMRDVGRFTGTLESAEQFIVAPKIAGRLETLHVNIGDVVRHGQLIATLDDAEFREQVAQATADLNVAQAQLLARQTDFGVTKRDYERIKQLNESGSGIVTEADLDTAQARYELAEANVTVAQAQLAQRQAAVRTAEVRLGYTRIHTNWADPSQTRVVGEKFVDPGAMLSANAPIVSILDLSTVTAVITVIERDYARIRLKHAAVVTTDAFLRDTFTGQIARIAPILRATTRQARVEVTIPNPDGRLKPGMFVRVSLEFERRAEVPTVPLGALVRRNDRVGVFVVEHRPSAPPAAPPTTTTTAAPGSAAGAAARPPSTVARFVPVITGINDGYYVEIVEPEDFDGDVVTLGHHLVEDGAPLRLPVVSSGQGGGR